MVEGPCIGFCACCFTQGLEEKDRAYCWHTRTWEEHELTMCLKKAVSLDQLSSFVDLITYANYYAMEHL